MAYEMPSFCLSLPSDQDMTAVQFVPVVVGAAANTVGQGQGGAAVTIAGTGVNNVIGVVQNNPMLGEAANVMVSGITKCKAVGTIPLGGLVGAGANGAIVAASGKQAFGRALEAAVAGDTFSVLLGFLGIQP